jgi:hypothetical protein
MRRGSARYQQGCPLPFKRGNAATLSNAALTSTLCLVFLRTGSKRSLMKSSAAFICTTEHSGPMQLKWNRT